jgi:hypothetical protein
MMHNKSNIQYNISYFTWHTHTVHIKIQFTDKILIAHVVIFAIYIPYITFTRILYTGYYLLLADR